MIIIAVGVGRDKQQPREGNMAAAPCIARSKAEKIVAALMRHEHVNITIGDQIMAAQLKWMLGVDRIGDLHSDALTTALKGGTQLCDWLTQSDVRIIAQAIRLSHEADTPQDE